MRSIEAIRSLESTSTRCSGNSCATSSSSRSTPGPQATKRVRRLAFRAGGRRRRGEAAMVADELALEAVIDQPGVAVRAIEAEAAGAAERERRVAAAIEKQQRLLAALERGLHRAGEPRRDEAAARRAFALQVDRLDRGLMLAAEALGEREPPVAPAPRIDDGLDRGRRGREHDRNVGDARAHHRHVARVIVHAVFLLVDRVVLFIDHDQAEIGVGEKQRRARADHDVHLAGRDRAPGARALARRRARNAIRPGARRSAARSGRGTAR